MLARGLSPTSCRAMSTGKPANAALFIVGALRSHSKGCELECRDIPRHLSWLCPQGTRALMRTPQTGWLQCALHILSKHKVVSANGRVRNASHGDNGLACLCAQPSKMLVVMRQTVTLLTAVWKPL